MRIAVRADGSERIGLGHIRRTVSLAHGLRERGAQVRFYLRRIDVDCAGWVREAAFDATWLGDGEVRDEASDAAAFLERGAAFAPERVVVDHYRLGADWHRRVRAGGAGALVAIDDLADRPLEVDLLIDPNLAADHRAKYAKRLPAGAEILGGPAYALLAPAYASAPRCEIRADVRRIGIFMGGTDEYNLSETALDACRRELRFAGTVEIATTRHNPHLSCLRQRAERDACQTLLAIDQPDLAAFFVRNDLHVGAGGGATWERCCLGAPAVGVIVADNQLPSLVPLAQAGAVALVAAQPASAGDIAAALEPLMADPALRRSMSAAARRLVDGRGARRAAERIVAR
jgi:UDP-2,4-diacetamido-2,4,6-trideoxy-beta-L-altropyranose hydrolase